MCVHFLISGGRLKNIENQPIITTVLDPIYTGLVTTVQVLYLLEICCLGWVFIILNDEVKMLIFQLFLQISEICFQKAIVQYITLKTVALYLKKL